MVLIKLKLKENSIKDYLVTQSGNTIDKNHFEIVDDTDKDIAYYIANRNDLIFTSYSEEETEPKENKSKSTKTTKTNKSTKNKKVENETTDSSEKTKVDDSDSNEVKEDSEENNQ